MGFIPIHVRIIIIWIKKINDNLFKIEYFIFIILILLFNRGKNIKIIIDIINEITPPSLLGIDRKIEYANKKYHSGWIWGGVTMGFASIKFSGSFRKLGNKLIIFIIIINIIKNPIISFRVK